MKKSVVVILICVITAFVIAAEGENTRANVTERSIQRGERSTPLQMTRPNPLRERITTTTGQRRRSYVQVQARRAQVQAEAMAELEAIIKIAKEEGATRTVEAIQALIDKKNAEYKDRVARMETQRSERAAQIRRAPQKEPPQQAEKKKADKE